MNRKRKTTTKKLIKKDIIIRKQEFQDLYLSMEIL